MTRGQASARQILGDDFIAPEEVVAAKVKSITYTPKQLQRLAKTMPAAKVLQWLKQHNYILLPGKVGDDSKVKWLALRKDGVPDSRFKTYKEQRRLLLFKERVPSMEEVIWGIGTYFDVRGIRLMNEGYCVRTSSNPDGQAAQEFGRLILVDDGDGEAAVGKHGQSECGVEIFHNSTGYQTEYACQKTFTI
ncbi:MAG: hypothetical protein WC310_04395 [Patescibacteria group bacterium]|jgi:hypothetical protein